ncbi:MAG: glycosyltransferase family 9 protein [Leptolyngbya sp. SIO1D8]|nr:glycosyltransferase family 9 protein [Leptolyngbya sp. SIO1D8]
MRVLAIVPGGISEQLLFLPTLEHLKQALPKAEISVVTQPSTAVAYRVSKVVQATIPYAFTSNNSPADWANLLGIMRDREFEIVITTSQSWSIGLLLWLSGIPTRVGYAGGANGLFLTATVPYKVDQYQAAQYHDLLAPIDLPGTCPAASINVPQNDISWVENQIQVQGIGEQGYVLIYPGPADGAPEDAYPVESWIAIAQDFQKRQPGLPLVLLQQADTGAAVKAIAQALPALKVIRPDNLGQVAALVAGANLVLSTDSYVSQLGVALNVFTLALFGSYVPKRRFPPMATSEQRFLGIKSDSDKVAHIPPEIVLKKVWGEG